MKREVPRTVWSLSPHLQRDMPGDDYEIIVVDNGSTKPFDRRECLRYGGNISFHSVAHPTHSPVAAINLGLAQAKGDLIGVMIDGARLASPGLLSGAINAAKLHHRPVIGTVAFHLGPDIQTRSAHFVGYNQKYEDELLDAVKWTANPYRLFEIACFAGSSRGGWFAPLRESNALFLTADHWRELGGCDEAFQSPGGGLANHDMWLRALASPDTKPIVILGEGTFHQIHNDFSTWKSDRLKVFNAEYERIRGQPYSVPRYSATYVGNIPPATLSSVEYSAGLQRHRQGPWRGDRASAIVSAIGNRPFRAAIEGAAINLIQRGVSSTQYLGVSMPKSPFDLGIYMQLIGRLRPRTIIQVGSKQGGSAIWFADQQSNHQIAGRVISIDKHRPPEINDRRIEFWQGDVTELGRTLSRELLGKLEHPLLVVESSTRYDDVLSVLKFFHRVMSSGDYFVVEGGVLSQLYGAEYGVDQDGPNRAITYFLRQYQRYYAIDAELCDFYGHNITWNPNGWLRRQ
jgi:cephalosporin hydroxylase/glycosyltransferase involved in cell wall biosynthesis